TSEMPISRPMPCRLELQARVGPPAFGAARFDHRFDELHAARSVFHGGHCAGQRVRRAPLPTCLDLLGHVAVDLRKALEVTLWMSGGNACRMASGGTAAAAAARYQPGVLGLRRGPGGISGALGEI